MPTNSCEDSSLSQGHGSLSHLFTPVCAQEAYLTRSILTQHRVTFRFSNFTLPPAPAGKPHALFPSASFLWGTFEAIGHSFIFLDSALESAVAPRSPGGFY